MPPIGPILYTILYLYTLLAPSSFSYFLCPFAAVLNLIFYHHLYTSTPFPSFFPRRSSGSRYSLISFLVYSRSRYQIEKKGEPNVEIVEVRKSPSFELGKSNFPGKRRIADSTEQRIGRVSGMSKSAEKKKIENQIVECSIDRDSEMLVPFYGFRSFHPILLLILHSRLPFLTIFPPFFLIDG